MSPTILKNGQSLTEYLILLVFISVVSMVTVQSLGKTIQRKIQLATSAIQSGVAFKDIPRIRKPARPETERGFREQSLIDE